jgi:hypothetical protein
VGQSRPSATSPLENQMGQRDVDVPVSDVDEIKCTSTAAWHAWLAKNHSSKASVWLITHKKASPEPSLDYNEMVCEALCWGWVDSKVARVDELRTKTYFTPRRPGSRSTASARAGRINSGRWRGCVDGRSTCRRDVGSAPGIRRSGASRHPLPVRRARSRPVVDDGCQRRCWTGPSTRACHCATRLER